MSAPSTESIIVPGHLSRVLTALFVVVLAIVAALALGAASASAANGRQQIGAFGPDGTDESQFQRIRELAFDQATKHLYALDATANKIYGFNATNPDKPIPLGDNFPIGVDDAYERDSLAVDNTNLGSAGNIYYGSIREGKIFGFDSSGAPLGGNFPVSMPSSEITGLAVDPAGHFWVVDESGKTVSEYSSTGVPEGVSISTAGVAGAFNAPDRIAFDSNGDLYVRIGGTVYKYIAAGGYASHAEVAGSGSTFTLAINSVTHQLYRLPFPITSAVFPAPLDVRDVTGTLLYQFGAGIEGAQYLGVAIDQSTDSVFVSDGGSFDDNSHGTHRQVVVFGAYGPEIFFVPGVPSGITGTQATLNGSVNSSGSTIAECRFEYGLTKKYGQSAPCSGSIPADSTPHAIQATIGNLVPQSTYHFRIAVKRGSSTFKSDDTSFETAETFFTKPASSVGDMTATLNGTVDLEGVPLAECKFEYGPTSLYGASKPCIPAAGSIPADFSEHAVSASLSGLLPQGKYHFRLVVANASGTFAGKDAVFGTFGPPLIGEEEASSVGATSATLLAQVDPRSSATGYHFEWGTDTSYGHRIPAEGEISAGSGGSAVTASTELSGLEIDSTYHFRLVASNGSGTTEGPDQVFTTFRPNASCPNAAIRSAQVSSIFPQGTISLPDCMALEMVSPPKKFNQRSTSPQFSPGGERIQFTGEGGLVDTPSLSSINNPYVSTRGSSGWRAQYVLPPATISAGYTTAARPCTYTPDFSHWTTWGSTDLQSQVGITVPSRGTLGGDLSPIGPPVRPLKGGVAGNGGTIGAIKEGICEGGSADATHLFFSIFDAAYLPGDPQPSESGTSLIDHGNVYEAYLNGEGIASVRLLQRDRDGNVVGGHCGAQIGGGSGNHVRYRGSVSTDASRVYFSARPSQPEGVFCDIQANKTRIMKWQDTPSGPTIAPLFSSECTRVSPPCSGADGDDEYQGASQEGTKVYFTSTRQLVDSDLDTTKDLYLYDASRPEGERLTQVSSGDVTDPNPGKDAGFLGLADFSGDGSRAYFVAKGVLTTALNLAGGQAELGKPNLYLYERDEAHPNGQTSFIATLSPADSATWSDTPGEWNEAKAVPRLGSDVEDLSVGGDGHIFVFDSSEALTADDGDGGQPDIYRYDSESGLLERVSKADAGGSDNGAFPVRLLGGEAVPGAQSVSFYRAVSEDGRTIVFESKEGLDPSNTGGKENTYIWRDGTLTAIPNTIETSQTSMSGEEVGFTSDKKLLPQDGDTVNDAYILRAGGGFPIVVPPPPCDGEACQGPPSARPAEQGAASGASTAGNAKGSPPHRCRKGSVHRHGRCVKQPKPRKHRKQAKRGGHKQGGQK